MRQMILFTITALTLLVATVGWLGFRLVEPWRPGPWLRVGGWGLLLSLVLLFPVSFSLGRVYEGVPWADATVRFAHVAMGFFSLVVGLLLLRDLGWLVLRGLDLLAPLLGAGRFLADEATRLTLLRGSGLVVLLGAGVLGAAGSLGALREPRITEVRLPVAGLPPAFEGYRIVQITDVHLSPTIRGDRLSTWVARVNDLAPDLVAITGDLADGTAAHLAPEVGSLRDLRAPDGVLFVTGNHEYYWDLEGWLRLLPDLGVTVLLNEHRVVRRVDASLVVAGITDHRAGSMSADHAPDPQRALIGAPGGAPRILLAHQPRSARSAREAGFQAQLSGHTHGGQFFPWNLAVAAVEPFTAGLYDVDGMSLYVSRGTGWWGPPMRLGAPTEITVLTLVPAGSGGQAPV